MSSLINWQNLRSWHGSQHSAFEEVCCQLAASEKLPTGSVFIRKGTPDAGVECFWRLPNSGEWAWQAKFFLTVDESQWKQLDQSVKTALDKHPHLVSYTICLPIDRQDPRIDGKKWLMDKWNNYVQKWQEWAQSRGMVVQFQYWGEYEIFERLTREEHRGRFLFWFKADLFSQHWFRSRLDEAIANAGPRYSPELNVELPIAKLFDGLGRTVSFLKRLKACQRKIEKIDLKYVNSSGIDTGIDSSANSAFTTLQDRVNQIIAILSRIDQTAIAKIDFNTLSLLASEACRTIYELADILKQISKQKGYISSNRKLQNIDGKPSLTPEYQVYVLDGLNQELSSLRTLADSNEAALSNVKALLLLGNAGIGKTHLFCDVAESRTDSGLPTILLLGEHFSNSEPWSQIIGLLGLSCTREDLLGALEAAAQARQTRALILIDALNEGDGKRLWKKYFAGLLTTLQNFPHIGIAVSVRTPYEDVIIPQHLRENCLVRETHYGFSQHEYEATRKFFDYFKLNRPNVPLLNPEFQNPLFLKLFCQGLNNLRLTEVPSGFHGMSAVFERFIESVNTKLADEAHLNFDKTLKVVQRAVKNLVEAIAENNSQWLPREKAQQIVDSILPREGYQNSLFLHLLIEGVIAEDRFWRGHGESVDGIRFAYERFSDHFIASYYLERYLDPNNPAVIFNPNNRLGLLLKDDWTCYENRGLLEAFSIQLPERIGKELVEVAPHCADYSASREAFAQSLIWRDPKSISETTHRLIALQFSQDDEIQALLLDAFLTLASNSNHPFNADFLHQRLKQDAMPDRDAWWSTFLHYQYAKHKAVDRLVDWALTSEDKSHIDDSAIRLCAIALAWFLTTSNRFLRDRATKALVALLTPRIHLLRQVISEFIEIDDWYVLERLCAVAYGCAMRSQDNAEIARLAQDIYIWVFENGEPIPHLLLRDYARGVIELALSRRIELQLNVELVRPPYKSAWFSSIPTDDELKVYTSESEQVLQENRYSDHPSVNRWRSVFAIKDSLLDRGGFSGDFARYVIGTNSGSFDWTAHRLDEPPTPQEIYDDFLESLTQTQRRAWQKYHRIVQGVERYRKLRAKERLKKSGRKLTEKQLKDGIAQAERSLRKALGKRKNQIFDESIVSYSQDSLDSEQRFDLTIAQRWIFWRVFDLGWTVERFGWFDANQNSQGRAANKAERIVDTPHA